MSGHAELLPRYKRLREVGRKVADTLVKRLKKDVLDEGGQKLGILQKNVLVLDSEDELAVLMDFCLHDIRRQGRTTIEQFLAEAPYPPDSDEMIFLESLKEARFTLMMVEATEPGVGIHVRDVVWGGTKFIFDVNFSRSAPQGMVLAARIVSPENVTMTTGAALPVGQIPASERDRWLRELAVTMKLQNYSQLSPEQRSQATADIIRTCLQMGSASHITYEEPTTRTGRSQVAASRTIPARIGRNDPCPCGSGKKFKKCCGAKR
jgi:hypothetical protein